MRWLYLGAVISFFLACGDEPRRSSDDDDGGDGGQNAGGTINPAATTTTGGGGDPAAQCPQLCSIVYDCGLEQSAGGGGQLCPGFTGSATEKAAFVGDEMSGCVQICQGPSGPVLQSQIDPADCDGTIENLSSLSSEFNTVCQYGFATGAGGYGGS